MFVHVTNKTKLSEIIYLGLIYITKTQHFYVLDFYIHCTYRTAANSDAFQRQMNDVMLHGCCSSVRPLRLSQACRQC